MIDESHNFRNADYADEKESRYQRLMRQVIREGVKTKVLMLSATPVNNRFNDLKNQLAARLRGRVGEPRPAPEPVDHGREGLQRRPARLQRLVEAAARGPHHRPDPQDARLRLLRAARRGDHRPLAQAHPGLLRHDRDRRVPRAAPAGLDPRSRSPTCPASLRSTRSSNSSRR